MRLLRRLLVRVWFAGTTDSAQRVLRLFGREICLRGTPSPAPAPVVESCTGTKRRERGRSDPLGDHPSHAGGPETAFPLHCFHSLIAVIRCIVGLSSVVVHHDPYAVSLSKIS